MFSSKAQKKIVFKKGSRMRTVETGSLISVYISVVRARFPRYISMQAAKTDLGLLLENAEDGFSRAKSVELQQFLAQDLTYRPFAISHVDDGSEIHWEISSGEDHWPDLGKFVAVGEDMRQVIAWCEPYIVFHKSDYYSFRVGLDLLVPYGGRLLFAVDRKWWVQRLRTVDNEADSQAVEDTSQRRKASDAFQTYAKYFWTDAHFVLRDLGWKWFDGQRRGLFPQTAESRRIAVWLQVPEVCLYVDVIPAPLRVYDPVQIPSLTAHTFGDERQREQFDALAKRSVLMEKFKIAEEARRFPGLRAIAFVNPAADFKAACSDVEASPFYDAWADRNAEALCARPRFRDSAMWAFSAIRRLFPLGL